MRRHANVNVSSNLCICLDVFCLFLCPFLMNWGKTIVWKSGSRRGNFNAAIIEVRVCLPFNHTMPEKQKSTSTVISFSLLTCSLKLKDIPIIQGEPLMHIHKGHYLEEECQNSPEGACFVFPRINVYMFVLPRWHSFKGSVHKTKTACISVYAHSLSFFSVTHAQISFASDECICQLFINDLSFYL